MEPKAQEYLLQIPLWTRQKNSLEQVREFLVELGEPDERLSILHVAGSNGKGSVCADLTAVLLRAGYRVGTFISPHLVDIRERFLINGEMVCEEKFQTVFDRVYEVVQQMLPKGYCHPTFFEYLFLMAMVLFAGEDIDYVILETGLGGRLDTTNVIRHPLACIITSISLEHTQYLGETIQEIAGEKAGIIKQGIPVIYDDNRPEASQVIRERIKAQNGSAYPVGEADSYGEVEFAAPYQTMNAALAVRALEVLAIPGVDRDVCKDALAHVRWQGRMEAAGDDIWLDGAHNPDGIQAFLRAARRLQQKDAKNIHLLFAAVADKDYNEMVQMLTDGLQPVRVTAARLSSERSLELDTLVETFRQAGCSQVEGYPDTLQALTAALSHKSRSDRLFIVGSLYLIGEMKEHLRRNENAGFRERTQPL